MLATVAAKVMPLICAVKLPDELVWRGGRYCDVIPSIAAQIGAEVDVREGRVYLVAAGSVRDSVVVPVGARDTQDAAVALTTALGEAASVAEVGDSVIINYVRSAEPRVRAIVESLVSRCVHAEVCFVLADQTAARRLEANIGSSGSASLRFGEISDAVVNALISGQWAATGGEAFSHTLQHTGVSLCDGRQALIESGGNTVVPQRSISPEGTVTTTGYQTIQSGLTVKLDMRRVSDEVVLIADVTLSAVDGYVEGYPILSNRAVQSALPVRVGAWTALATLDRVTFTRENNGFISFGNSKSGAHGVVLVLVRLHVGGQS